MPCIIRNDFRQQQEAHGYWWEFLTWLRFGYGGDIKAHRIDI
jgi:hypothetical protein